MKKISYRLDRNGVLLKFLRILITVMCFKDRNWIPKIVNCISCSVVCKIVFCSEFPDIPDNAGKVTRRTRRSRRRRRRTQAIAKRYAFHANAKSNINISHHFPSKFILFCSFSFLCPRLIWFYRLNNLFDSYFQLLLYLIITVLRQLCKPFSFY